VGDVPASVLTISAADGLELRELSATDAPTYYALVHANRDHLLRLNDDYVFEVNTTVDDFAARFENPDDESLLLGIWLGDRLVGHIALVYGEPPRWGLGYWLAEDATGRGFATAAVTAVVEYARAALGAAEVLAGVSHGNDKSVAVLERCGFRPVADFDTYTRYGLRVS
jgi:RimJ/RimL family protein N-acetyltransferase